MCLFKRKSRNKKTQKGTVEYNAQKMKKRYPLNEYGYFGESGDNKRVIYAKNHERESRRFYSQVSKGGEEIPLDNGRGVKKIMRDGGVVVYRKKTKTPNSPAVDLGGMKGKVKNQRIHFIKRETRR
ncbi:MAG: hypothetical protein IJX98_06870 [Clostridia bacterium]|nr:hypothetical protein [Clostridia bacterium]